MRSELALFHYLVTVHLTKPLTSVNSVDPKTGAPEILDRYLRFFYILAETLDDATEIVMEAVTDGDVVEVRGDEIEFWQLDEEMQKRFPSEQTRGVWHKSGLMLFNEAIESGGE